MRCACLVLFSACRVGSAIVPNVSIFDRCARRLASVVRAAPAGGRLPLRGVGAGGRSRRRGCRLGGIGISASGGAHVQLTRRGPWPEVSPSFPVPFHFLEAVSVAETNSDCLSRRTRSKTEVPGREVLTSGGSSETLSILLRLNSKITSPIRTPARAAGLSGVTLWTSAPRGLSRPIEVATSCVTS